MSDRVATECAELRSRIEEVHDSADDEEIRKLLRGAAGLLKDAEKIDREQHGHTPEDKLAATIEGTDECLNCGEDLEKGGWCGPTCLREYDDEAEEGAA